MTRVFQAKKIAASLNFKAGEDSITISIAKCEIKTIITSKPFVKKTDLKEMEVFVYLEDLFRKFRWVEKVLVFYSALFLPSFLLSAFYFKRDKDVSSEDMAAVIFSSGSTGEPKGVMLSHANIISNGEMVSRIMDFTSNDRMLGYLKDKNRTD